MSAAALRKTFDSFGRFARAFSVTCSLGAALVLLLGVSTGCQSDEKPDATANQIDDHGDHDHGDHDHGDHDHGSRVNAAAAGLDADDLVYLDRPEMPENLQEAVAQLTASRDDIANGFANDNVDSIHDQLHAIGDLLEAIETYVEDSDLSEENQKQALQAVETLFDKFGVVDAKLHGGEGKDYQEVADSIDGAVATLQDVSVPE